MPQFDSKFVGRLQRSIEKSHQQLRTFRRARYHALQEYVGGRYGKQPTATANPFNLIRSASSVYVPNLVAHNPRYQLRTDDMRLRATAWTTAEDLNKTIEEMRFAQTLRAIVVDSIFGVGIRKIGKSLQGRRQVGGRQVPVTKTFFKRVSLDNYVADPMARSREEALYEGDRFRLPLSMARKMYDAPGLKPTHRALREKEAQDLESEEQKGAVTGSELVDFTELYNIWIPDAGVVLTIPAEGSQKILKVVEWDGPERGPYDWLYYHEVPDNLMPAAPVGVWMDLNDVINTLARKIKREAERTKNVHTYEPEAAEGAEAIRDAEDDEWVMVKDVNKIESHEVGGTSEQTKRFISLLLQMFDRQAGNLSLLGGFSAQAGSATEAAKLDARAGIRLGDMKAMVKKFAERAGEDIGHYRYRSPMAKRRVVKKLPGTNIEIPVQFQGGGMPGSFDEYEVTIEPHSMAIQDSNAKARRMIQWWNNVVLPTLPIAARQGTTIDVPRFVQKVGQELGISRVDEFYKVAAPQAEAVGIGTGGGGEEGGGEQTSAQRMAEERAERDRTSQPTPEQGDVGEAGAEVLQGMSATRRQ